MSRLKLHVTPGAARDEIIGWQGDALRVRVKAPPQGGRANEAVRRLLAEALGLSLADVQLGRGQASRSKTVTVASLDEGDLRARLSLLMDRSDLTR